LNRVVGAVGVARAIANAVYHGTGARVRDLPITVEKLPPPPISASPAADAR
jgi:xanthine dehydrogenase YagR molybdenum-binding subunit